MPRSPSRPVAGALSLSPVLMSTGTIGKSPHASASRLQFGEQCTDLSERAPKCASPGRSPASASQAHRRSPRRACVSPEGSRSAGTLPPRDERNQGIEGLLFGGSLRERGKILGGWPTSPDRVDVPTSLPSYAPSPRQLSDGPQSDRLASPARASLGRGLARTEDAAASSGAMAPPLAASPNGVTPTRLHATAPCRHNALQATGCMADAARDADANSDCSSEEIRVARGTRQTLEHLRTVLIATRNRFEAAHRQRIEAMRWLPSDFSH